MSKVSDVAGRIKAIIKEESDANFLAIHIDDVGTLLTAALALVETGEPVGYGYGPEMQSGKGGFRVSFERTETYDTPVYIESVDAEFQRRWERCYPSKVLMINGVGHYVSDAVYEAFSSPVDADASHEKELLSLEREIIALREDADAIIERCAQLIEDGFVRPEIKTKHDKCAHDKFGWEDCEECCVAAIRSLKSSPKQDNGQVKP